MRKITFLLLGTALIASTAWAGGSIFKHKTKSVNTYGVHSIGVHVCSKLECPPVRIVEGKCMGSTCPSIGVYVCVIKGMLPVGNIVIHVLVDSTVMV